MKSNNDSEIGQKMARLTRRSFFVGLLAALIALVAWQWIRTQPDADGVPWVLRKSHEFNGALWSQWYRSGRLAKAEPPMRGRKPRVNGALGLDKKDFELAKWQMQVLIEDEPKMKLAMKDIRWLPKVETTTEFKCIEGWSDVISYAGVRFSDFVKMYNLPTQYKYVGLETPDGEYYVSLDMASMLHEQTLLAYEMNGAGLSLENGAPLRLIIPIKYGIKSLKRIGTIRFSNTRPADYWAERGYDWYSTL
jgi:hypothetical protein